MADTNATVLVATTSNISVSGALPSTIDDVSLATNDLVLACRQINPAENGIYKQSGGRATDFSTYSVFPGILVTVQQGSINAGTVWMCRIPSTGTINVAPIFFRRVESFTFDLNTITISATETTRQLQEHLDSLVVFDDGYPESYQQTMSLDTNALTLTNAHNRSLIRCTAPGRTTVTKIIIPKGVLQSTFQRYVACMSDQSVTIVGSDASVTVNLPVNFNP